MGKSNYLREILESGICPICKRLKTDINQQVSNKCGVGIMCTDCAVKLFSDHCGHPTPTPDEAGKAAD